MNTEQFTYWLQGYAELTTDAPTPEQWQSIKEHLALVFKKVTPPLGGHPPYLPYQAPSLVTPAFTDVRTIC